MPIVLSSIHSPGRGDTLMDSLKAAIREVARATGGSIYVIQRSQSLAFKVGFSISPQRRFADLTTGSDEPLRFVGSFPARLENERRLHRRLRRCALRGEWFWWPRPISNQEMEDFAVAAHAEDADLNDYVAITSGDDPVIKRLVNVRHAEMISYIARLAENARLAEEEARRARMILTQHPHWADNPSMTLAEVLGISES